VDLALSFQDNSGCLDIWSKITYVQNRANEMMHDIGRPFTESIDLSKSANNNNQKQDDIRHEQQHNQRQEAVGGRSIPNSEMTQSPGSSLSFSSTAHQHVNNSPQRPQGTPVDDDSSADDMKSEVDDDRDLRGAHATAVSMAAAAAAAYKRIGSTESTDSTLHSVVTSNNSSSNTYQFPSPPTLSNLEDIADIFASYQVSRAY